MTSGISPHCAVHFVGEPTATRPPWTVGETFTVVGPAFLIAIVIYVALQTPLWGTRSAPQTSVTWSAVTGVLIAGVGLLFAGSGIYC